MHNPFPPLSYQLLRQASLGLSLGLDMQFRNLLDKTLLIRRQRSLNLRLHKLLNLLRRTTDKCARLQQGIEVGDDGLEKGRAADALDQVVGFALLFDVVWCLVREDSYFVSIEKVSLVKRGGIGAR